MVKKSKLKNGLTILHEYKNSDVVAIQVCVSVGSNYETPNIAGISHFLEHMIFEGSTSRTSKQISEAIENVGGEMNAATSNERTYFYFKIPKKHFELGLEIMSDMIQNPAFDSKILEKERKVVLEEIKMVNDQPLMYQWVLFEKTLFTKHPTKNPVYGNVKAVKSIKKNNMINFHKKWYVPNNMSIAVVGGVKNINSKITKYFGSMKKSTLQKRKSVAEPIDKKPRIKKVKKKVEQSYFILGFKTVPRLHKDSYVLDLISTIFSKGLSGRINEEIRNKRGLAYSVGAVHETKIDFGIFAFYLNCDPKNVKLSKSIILEEIKKLDNIPHDELKAAKENMIGKISIDNEDSQKRADELTFWEYIKDVKYCNDYTKHIRSITNKDIIRVRDKYLKNYTEIQLCK